jgi:hypothetical protein
VRPCNRCVGRSYNGCLLYLAQVVASEDRARKVSSARKDRADEFRRMRLMSALHSQRSKETDQVGGVLLLDTMAAEQQYLHARAVRLLQRGHDTPVLWCACVLCHRGQPTGWTPGAWLHWQSASRAQLLSWLR